MSGYVDNRCSQATVSEVEALIRERDEALAKLASLVEAIEKAERMEAVYVAEHGGYYIDAAPVVAALRAARGEP